MAEYGSMFLVSGLAAILFYGGWNGPVPIFSEILPALTGWRWAYEQGETSWRVLGYVSQVAGVVNFIIKAVLFVTVMMWVRWTLPRLRIDQVMTTCLKYCVPLAAIFFIGAIGWKLLGIPFINDIIPHRGQTLADVRENWVLLPEPVAATTPATDQPRPAPSPAHPTPPPTTTTTHHSPLTTGLSGLTPTARLTDHRLTDHRPTAQEAPP
jgi:NADH-quinone oxidoreductase subunit H